MIAVLTDRDAIAAYEDDTDDDSGDDCYKDDEDDRDNDDDDENAANDDDDDNAANDYDDDNAANDDDDDNGAWLVHSSRPTWRSCLRDGNPAGGWPGLVLSQILNF